MWTSLSLPLAKFGALGHFVFFATQLRLAIGHEGRASIPSHCARPRLARGLRFVSGQALRTEQLETGSPRSGPLLLEEILVRHVLMANEAGVLRRTG
jgi:hypothetical protein